MGSCKSNYHTIMNAPSRHFTNSYILQKIITCFFQCLLFVCHTLFWFWKSNLSTLVCNHIFFYTSILYYILCGGICVANINTFQVSSVVFVYFQVEHTGRYIIFKFWELQNTFFYSLNMKKYKIGKYCTVLS